MKQFAATLGNLHPSRDLRDPFPLKRRDIVSNAKMTSVSRRPRLLQEYMVLTPDDSLNRKLVQTRHDLRIVHSWTRLVSSQSRDGVP